MITDSFRPLLRRRFLHSGLLLAALALSAAAVLTLTQRKTYAAMTFTVNSTGDTSDAAAGDGTCNDGTGACTLRAAIQEANAFAGTDTINFNLPGAGPHTIELFTALPALSQSVDILNTSGEGVTVQRSTVVGTPDFLIFTVNVGVTVNTSHLTISNGRGSGISNNGTLTLNDSTVSGNSGGNGCGIISSGPLTLNHSTVSGNSTDGQGGGINVQAGTTTLNDSTVSDNSASGGGGIISVSGTTLIINRSTISDNEATGNGGGLYCVGTLLLNNSTVSGNSSSSTDSGGGGGGIYYSGVTATINNSTISGNSAVKNGGGILNLDEDAVVTLNNSTVADNSAADGGGIFNKDIDSRLLAGTVNLNSSIVADNTATGTGPDINGVVTAGDYNLVESTVGIVGALPGTHNITGQDPQLGPLVLNGGPTKTHALFSSTNPAIDKGKNFAVDANNIPVLADQRGFARPVDQLDAQHPNAAGGDGSDIGAYELALLPPPVCLTCDGDSDGVPDFRDNCPTTPNPTQSDTDQDGIGDACDTCTDVDTDGVCDGNDNCPAIANADQANNDNDAMGDACDTDDDNDGVPDTADNCPRTSNASQADNDHDNIGDACDPDDDNDGVNDTADNCPLIANPGQQDSDHDGAGDACDPLVYNFMGFFQPVDNLPVVNVVQAGQAIPVKFSLGGNQGLNIFAAGYPASGPITCNSTDPASTVDEIVAAGGSSLTYDAATGQYTYVWKTNKAWKGTCRQFVLGLNDGSFHRANFRFK